MNNAYQTIGSIQKSCSDFASAVLSRSHEGWSDADLANSLSNSSEPVEIAAALYEVIFRISGLRLFASQLETAYALYRGHIAELPTGEGKTLAAVVAAVLYAKSGRKIHILVFNDYLAKRDAEENRPIFEFCGLSTAYITESTKKAERRAAYVADVLYISAREAGYDAIRDFIAYSPEELTGSTYDVAIVDEADSILIDEASIPLVLAGRAEERAGDALKMMDVVSKLSKEDYEWDEQNNQIWLNDSGIETIENAFLVENLYDDCNVDLLTGINTALQATHTLTRDKDYIVRDGQVAVIDESTGRVANNRKFPGMLHHFVEVKEGITKHISTKIYCTMTIGAFLEQYQTLCGMTGTAATSANELETTYQLRTVVIEPHTPCIRVDHPDVVFATDAARDAAVLEQILSAHQIGQPILIGTANVLESEKLSRTLAAQNIPHQVLNARNDVKEAEMISQAGKPYAVTVSTNMAGRGVDIKLGGSNEAEKEFVSSVGGLMVISTTINRSRRVDNQLKGRAGRQGDPGESRFFISLEDETIAPLLAVSEKGKPLSEKEKFSLVRSAQRTLEGNDAEARYTLKKYSYILEHQRRIISAYRLDLLLGNKTTAITKENDFDLYLKCEKEAGKEGVESAEKALSLYFINQHFSAYLEAMEEVKSGIHLTIVGGKNPFDEFNRIAIEAFEEMHRDIVFDVLSKMRECTITKEGIDLAAFGMIPDTGTWTYMVDDSTGQFNHLPALMNMLSKKIKKSLSFGERLERFLTKKDKK